MSTVREVVAALAATLDDERLLRELDAALPQDARLGRSVAVSQLCQMLWQDVAPVGTQPDRESVELLRGAVQRVAKANPRLRYVTASL